MIWQPASFCSDDTNFYWVSYNSLHKFLSYETGRTKWRKQWRTDAKITWTQYSVAGNNVLHLTIVSLCIVVYPIVPYHNLWFIFSKKKVNISTAEIWAYNRMYDYPHLFFKQLIIFWLFTFITYHILTFCWHSYAAFTE